jgi:protein-L-isoaspartate(D-aspartate) O-methyltransferase
MIDTYRHKGLRKKLMAVLKEKGIHDERVLKAMNDIPRHVFMDNAFVEFAYQDKAFPIGADQTISQPYTVAFQTQLLDVQRGEKVLEIGTGSGYQTCVLMRLTTKVFSIERQKILYNKSKRMIPSLGYQPKLFYGDGYKGLPGFAPFDKILITAGAPEVPVELIKQLRTGGVMVIPLDDDEGQCMKRITKLEDGELQVEEFGSFRFVPMLKDRAKD